MLRRVLIIGLFVLSVVGSGVAAEVAGFEVVDAVAACSSGNSGGGGC